MLRNVILHYQIYISSMLLVRRALKSCETNSRYICNLLIFILFLNNINEVDLILFTLHATTDSYNILMS